MTHTVPWDASQVLPWRAGLAYGLLGLPLAFAALPLYVVLPHYYASNLGLPLASVGALLLLVRLMDAGAEPLLGRLSDRLYRRTAHTVLWVVGASALLLGGGMAGLFFPPVRGPGHWRRGWWPASCSPAWRTVCWSSPTRLGGCAWGVTPCSAAASWPGARGRA